MWTVPNESYVKLVDKTTFDHEWPSHLYSKAKITYFKVCDKIEKAKALEGFKIAKKKAIVGMQAFKDSYST